MFSVLRNGPDVERIAGPALPGGGEKNKKGKKCEAIAELDRINTEFRINELSIATFLKNI